MKKILLSSALILSVFCLLASASAKAQDLFFDSAYARPAENVDGIHVGRRFHARATFAPTTAAVAQNCHAGAACDRRQIAHHIAH